MTDSLLLSHLEKKLLRSITVGGGSTVGLYITDNAGDLVTVDSFTFSGSNATQNYTLVGHTITFNETIDDTYNLNTVVGTNLNIGRYNKSEYHASYQPYITTAEANILNKQVDCILFGATSEVANQSILVGNRSKCDNSMSIVIGHDSTIYPTFDTITTTYISDNAIIVGHNSNINSAEITLVEPSDPSRTENCLLFGCNTETSGYTICIGNDTTNNSATTATGAITIGHNITNTRNSIIIGHGITNTTAQGALCLGVAPDNALSNACFIKNRVAGGFDGQLADGRFAIFDGNELFAGPSVVVTDTIDPGATFPVYLKITIGPIVYYFTGYAA